MQFYASVGGAVEHEELVAQRDDALGAVGQRVEPLGGLHAEPGARLLGELRGRVRHDRVEVDLCRTAHTAHSTA